MVYILLAMILYTASTMFGVVASRNGNTNITTAIINSVSALIPLAVIAPALARKEYFASKIGITAAVISGVAVAFYVMALIKSYSENKVAIVAPIVFGGTIFLSTILSYLFFKEKVLPVQGAGLVFLGIGLVLVIYSRAYGK